MKKKCNEPESGIPRFKKIVLVMRLTLLLIVMAVVSSSAASFGQNSKLNLNFKDRQIREILSQIEDQSEYTFMYDNKQIDVSRKVSVGVQSADIKEALDEIFKGMDVTYKIMDRHIMLVAEAGSVMRKNIKVSGKVTDTSGVSLPGVTVVVKGTTNGTITNFDGIYSLSDVPDNGIIQFSFVGMKMQEISVAGKSSISVEMEEDAIGIEEVVAVGYGTVKRKDLTGSVASVNGASLQDVPVTSAAQAIVGRMPGVQITKTEGSPDADIKIRVRGGGSITQDNSPLYIVDGFPVDDISDVAPTDIESIDILKDASSTAIYGARGANGVIIITTKEGSVGNAKISYNMYAGVKEVSKLLDVLSPYEYVYWQYELLNSNSSLTSLFGDFRDFDLYKEMSGTNWQEELFGRTGTSVYNNLAITGGDKSMKYNISFTRNDEKEIMLGSGYSRTNLTAKTSYKLKKWLKFDLNTRLSDLKLKGAGTGQSASGETNSRLPHIIQFRPVNGFADIIDESLLGLDDSNPEIANTYITNPLLQTEDDYRRYNRFLANINVAFEISITKDLKYRLGLGYEQLNIEEQRFFGLNTTNVRNFGEQPMVNIKERKYNTYRLVNTLTYTKKNIFPNSNISVLLGEELNSRKYRYLISSAKYFPKYVDAKTALNMMSLGSADPIQSFSNPDNNISSFFGRVNYDYKGRYLLSASLRADGSSKFAKGNQWGYFPAAALAWRISDENFMKSTENWLSNLKFRLSYGQSGNNRIADDAWKKTFSIATGRIFMDGNEETPTNFIIPESVLSNPELKWETTITRNLGLDFGLFNQRVTGTFEVYKNTTKDLLIRTSIPSSAGYSSQYQNIGQTSNKGLEISLDARIVDNNDFKLSASFNIGFNRNKIDKLGEVKQWEVSSAWAYSDGPSGDYLIEEGKSVGLMYGYETDGYYTFDDFNYNSDSGTYTFKEGVSDNTGLILPQLIAPGMLKFVNQDDDLEVNAADKVVIGNAMPKHTGGFNITSQYKGFDISMYFNWVYGNNIYNANKLNFTNYQSARPFKNLLDIMNSDNRFTYYSQETGELVFAPDELAALNQNATMWSAGHRKTQLHSWAVEDGSFLRLNNLTLGYTFPKKIVEKLKLEKLRFYFSGYNLWTWTKYSGYDPEVDTRRSTPLTPGVDWCAYPRSRTYNIGLNVTF